MSGSDSEVEGRSDATGAWGFDFPVSEVHAPNWSITEKAHQRIQDDIVRFTKGTVQSLHSERCGLHGRPHVRRSFGAIEQSISPEYFSPPQTGARDRNRVHVRQQSAELIGEESPEPVPPSPLRRRRLPFGVSPLSKGKEPVQVEYQGDLKPIRGEDNESKIFRFFKSSGTLWLVVMLGVVLGIGAKSYYDARTKEDPVISPSPVVTPTPSELLRRAEQLAGDISRLEDKFHNVEMDLEVLRDRDTVINARVTKNSQVLQDAQGSMEQHLAERMEQLNASMKAAVHQQLVESSIHANGQVSVPENVAHRVVNMSLSTTQRSVSQQPFWQKVTSGVQNFFRMEKPVRHHLPRYVDLLMRGTRFSPNTVPINDFVGLFVSGLEDHLPFVEFELTRRVVPRALRYVHANTERMVDIKSRYYKPHRFIVWGRKLWEDPVLLANETMDEKEYEKVFDLTTLNTEKEHFDNMIVNVKPEYGVKSVQLFRFEVFPIPGHHFNSQNENTNL